MSSLEEEGRRIAKRLGQGVTYRGPWLPYGPGGEFLGHFFQDDAVTETSFVAKTFEEAKANLIDIRKKWGAKPPVFANPGNISRTTEEWDRAFLRALPVVSLAFGVISSVMGIWAAQRSSPLEQRVYSEDGTYLVDVRYGQWHDLRDFVQPGKPDVLAIYSQIGPDVWSLYDFVCRNIDYRRDLGEFWLTPGETLKGYGDCEDTSILLTSLLRNFTNAHVALGSFQGYGHAWCDHMGQIMETTYTRAMPTSDPEDYCLYCLFNEREVIELWPGALGEIFEMPRDEATKLNLIAEAIV